MTKGDVDITVWRIAKELVLPRSALLAATTTESEGDDDRVGVGRELELPSEEADMTSELNDTSGECNWIIDETLATVDCTGLGVASDSLEVLGRIEDAKPP
jgi:hypothetical protein